MHEKLDPLTGKELDEICKRNEKGPPELWQEFQMTRRRLRVANGLPPKQRTDTMIELCARTFGLRADLARRLYKYLKSLPDFKED